MAGFATHASDSLTSLFVGCLKTALLLCHMHLL
jgi:hypothetical protein